MGLITDIVGVKVGHFSDYDNITGCTVILFDKKTAGSVDIRGGGTSTRQIDVLLEHHNIGSVNAIFLTGGSAYGLEASCGVMRFLEERGIGLRVANGAIVPSVPSAVIFDLGIGNSNFRPTAQMAYNACINADKKFKQGSVGAGTGATVGKYLGISNATKGGLASESIILGNGITVGVIVVVNAFGNIYDYKQHQIIAGVRNPKNNKFISTIDLIKNGVSQSNESFQNTTLAVIATDGKFNKSELMRIARIANTGISRVINPCHTVSDGDIVFAVSCGDKKANLNDIGIISSDIVSRAIVKAVKISKSLGGIPSCKELTK